jgi:hypothetical protein
MKYIFLDAIITVHLWESPFFGFATGDFTIFASYLKAEVNPSLWLVLFSF